MGTPYSKTPAISTTLKATDIIPVSVDIGGGNFSSRKATVADITAATTLSWTKAPGDPPTDGSVPTMLYKNTTSLQKFINTGTISVPTWEAI
jgi:hypothetical protein